MRHVYRQKLLSYVNDGHKNYLNAREDLIRNYQEREIQNNEQLQSLTNKISKINGELTALKKYSMKLKHLAEDWAPVGEPLP